MYYVYVIQNPNGILYKGLTEDLKKRLNQHNSSEKFPSFTNGKGPWKVVYKEEHPNIQEARKREKFLKSGKGRIFLKGRLSAMADG